MRNFNNGEEPEMPVPFQMAPNDEVRTSGKRRRMLLALALAAAFATLPISATPTAALADGGPHQDRDADVTFTKWVTTLPADPSTLAGVHMAGVVGGDVGRGRYVGKVLGDDTTSKPGFWLGHARYGFRGRKHAFIANLHLPENDTVAPITATIRGVVRTGWLKGARVTGVYTQRDSCPIPTPGNVFGTTCFQGTLHLELGENDDD